MPHLLGSEAILRARTRYLKRAGVIGGRRSPEMLTAQELFVLGSIFRHGHLTGGHPVQEDQGRVEMVMSAMNVIQNAALKGSSAAILPETGSVGLSLHDLAVPDNVRSRRDGAIASSSRRHDPQKASLCDQFLQCIHLRCRIRGVADLPSPVSQLSQVLFGLLGGQPPIQLQELAQQRPRDRSRCFRHI